MNFKNNQTRMLASFETKHDKLILLGLLPYYKLTIQ